MFQDKNCYPDIWDLEGTARRQHSKLTKQQLSDLYQQFRMAYEWLQVFRKVCWRDGKHESQSAQQVKAVAEPFTGPISNEAFLLAAFQARLKVRNGEIKLPPFFNADKWRSEWLTHISRLSIKEESVVH